MSLSHQLSCLAGSPKLHSGKRGRHERIIVQDMDVVTPQMRTLLADSLTHKSFPCMGEAD